MSEAQERRLQGHIAHALATDCEGNFERLVLAYQDRIVAFCTGLSKDRSAAQEIAQDTFVRAYRALKTYDAARIRELSLRAWLYQIALNLTKNAGRRKRFELTGIEGATELRASADIEREAEQAELARTIRGALARLPAHMRAAVVLRHLDELPYDEIARITGHPEGTIKSHVHRGLALLRKELPHVNV